MPGLMLFSFEMDVTLIKLYSSRRLISTFTYFNGYDNQTLVIVVMRSDIGIVLQS